MKTYCLCLILFLWSLSPQRVVAQTTGEIAGEWHGVWMPTIWFLDGVSNPVPPLFTERELVFEFYPNVDDFDDYGRIHLGDRTFASMKTGNLDGMILRLWDGLRREMRK